MNNTYFIFLIRRDHVLQLTAHLAAGILALVLLTGFFQPDPVKLSDTGAQTARASLVSGVSR